MNITRRRILVGAAAAPAILKLSVPALARAPMAAKQVPSVYRVKVGGIEVTAVADGIFSIPSKMFSGKPDEMSEVLTAHGQADPLPTPVLTYLVNTGDKLVLIDTGAALKFGPSLNNLVPNLAAAGVKPSDIDIVALTHAHGDHCNGLITAEGKPVFENAQIFVSEPEAKFWFDDAILAKVPAGAKPFFAMARDALTPYAAKTTKFGDKAEIAPGVSAESAPGHTPGHTMFRISSGKDQLLIFGDIFHSVVLQSAHPEWTIAFDVDPAMATSTRRRVLDMVATDKLTFAGAHVLFPGMGTVAKAGMGYRYQPAQWQIAI